MRSPVQLRYSARRYGKAQFGGQRRGDGSVGFAGSIMPLSYPRKCSPLRLMTNGRTKMYKNIVDGNHQMETGHAGILQRSVERDPPAGHQHRTGDYSSRQIVTGVGVNPTPDCANSDGSKSVKDLLKPKAQTKTEEFYAIKLPSGCQT